MKELVFHIDENNYIDFLQSILEKHGQGHFKVSEKKHFFESATSRMVQRQQCSVGEPSEREHYSLYC